MIYVSRELLSQVEYLILQSVQGNHVLFEQESLRKIFGSHPQKMGRAVSAKEASSAEAYIEKLILLPTLAQKKAYLERLDPKIFKLVVKTYFSLVENNISEKQQVKH